MYVSAKLSDYINISHREIDSHTFFGRDGSLLCAWEIEGIDCETLSAEAINRRLHEIGKSLVGAEENDTLWITLERRLCKDISPDTSGQAAHLANVLQSNDHQVAYENKLFMVFQSDVAMAEGHERPKLFHAKANQVTSAFERHFQLRPLGTSWGQNTSEFYDLVHRMMHVSVGPELDGGVCGLRNIADRFSATFTQSQINALPNINGKSFALFTLDGIRGQDVNTRGLRDLETLGADYRWTTRLKLIPVKKFGGKVKARQKELQQASGDLARTIATGQSAVKDVGSSIAASELETVDFLATRGGEFYCSIVSGFFFRGDVAELEIEDEEHSDGQAIDFFTQLDSVATIAGISLIIEREHAFVSYLELIPGTRGGDRRDRIVEAGLGLCLCPVQTIWKGSKTNPSQLFKENSPCLMQGYSFGGERFHFNLHAGDRGHTLIIGPTGGGKSVLLSAIATSFLQYENAQVIFFDKLKSSFASALALGGAVYDFSSQTSRGMSPLGALKDLGPEWGLKWLEMLLSQAGITKDPDTTAMINQFMSIYKDNGGTFGNLLDFSFHQSVKSAFEIYLNDPHLDARDSINKDSPIGELDWNPFTVFEAGDLFSASPQKALLVLDYLFECVDHRLDDRPTLLIIDEAKAFLAHEIFATRIEAWINELGKKNVALVMASQSWSHFADSPCGNALRENTFTRIFMQNTDALEDKIANDLQGAGLSDHQIQIVNEMTPKRHYLVTQKDRSGGSGERLNARVVDFGFGLEFLNLITATNSQDSKKALREQPNDPQFWLRNLVLAQE